MTTKELLKPRYKVIAIYPTSKYANMGKVLIPENDEQELYYKNEPLRYKKLYWWEDRNIKTDMPKYIRFSDGTIDKIDNYLPHFKAKYIWSALNNSLPSTEEEYNEFVLSVGGFKNNKQCYQK